MQERVLPQNHGICSEIAPKMFLEFLIPILNVWIFTIFKKVLCTLQNVHSRKVNYKSLTSGENQHVAWNQWSFAWLHHSRSACWHWDIIQNKTLALNEKKKRTTWSSIIVFRATNEHLCSDVQTYRGPRYFQIHAILLFCICSCISKHIQIPIKPLWLFSAFAYENLLLLNAMRRKESESVQLQSKLHFRKPLIISKPRTCVSRTYH